MTRIVLRPHQLLLEDPIFIGTLCISGYVVNGDWHFLSNGERDLSYRTCWPSDFDPLNPVTHFPARPQSFVFVPASVSSDYNEALHWSENEPAADPADLVDLLDQAAIDEINHKRKIDDEFDLDEIPF